MSIDLTYENDRRALHRVRARINADRPDGHTYSNILELRKNWEASKPGDYCQQNIPRLMKVQEHRLAIRRA